MVINIQSYNKDNILQFEDIDITFDESFNIKVQTGDYLFIREILTNEKIVKNTTFFGCGLPKSDYDIHLLLDSLIEKDKHFKPHYGIKKVFHSRLKKYIGFAGLVRCSRKISPYNNTVVEGEVFLKEEYIGSGLGFRIEKVFESRLEERQEIVIASIWEGNTASIRLIEKLNMSFVGKIEKCYNGKTVYANMYIKFPSSLRNADKNINLEAFFITKKIS